MAVPVEGPASFDILAIIGVVPSVSFSVQDIMSANEAWPKSHLDKVMKYTTQFPDQEVPAIKVPTSIIIMVGGSNAHVMGDARKVAEFVFFEPGEDFEWWNKA